MRTLLLADESITVQRVIALTFAEEPIRVVAVGDGQQAMDTMAAQQPDIVLAGTALPQVNGYDLAKFMRGKTELRKVPVLLLSGAFESVDEARLAASGANGVLEKPVEPTVVISRVKELLGMKTDDKPPQAGRVAQPVRVPGGASTGQEPRPASNPSPRPVSPARPMSAKWDELRGRSLEPNARSVEDPSTRADDYLDTLDAAFDSLDRQLSGRAPQDTASKAQRNPSGPIGHAAGAADPRSPGRTPAPPSTSSAAGNPVFEVDDEWFGPADTQAREDARAGRRDATETTAPELQPPAQPASADPVFEVDDDWFAEDDKARAARLAEQQLLAKEMGIHEVELPEVEPAIGAPAPAADLDFDFGVEDFKAVAEPPAAEEVKAPAAPQAVKTPERADAPKPLPPPPVIPAPAPVARVAPASARTDSGELRRDRAGLAFGREGGPAPASGVADDFAALLAFEQGLTKEPPKPVAPEVTDEMLDEIASRVVVPPPVVTDEMLDQIASRVVPPPPLEPEVTDAMLDQIASRVVPPPPLEPVVTDAMLDQIASRVVPPPPLEPVVTDDMLDQIAKRVVPPAPLEPVVTDAMLDQIAARVTPVPPQVTEQMLNDIAARVVPFAPEITPAIIEQISAKVAEQLKASAMGEELRDAVSAAVKETVRSIVSETSERLVREEIDRIRSRKP